MPGLPVSVGASVVACSMTVSALPPPCLGGWSLAQLLTPKMRAERPITHSAAGGLSTVIALPASSEPKNHAFQLFVPL